eukprot:scaffold49384_cov60-Phaeocystis_antarctica.AAC.2
MGNLLDLLLGRWGRGRRARRVRQGFESLEELLRPDALWDEQLGIFDGERLELPQHVWRQDFRRHLVGWDPRHGDAQRAAAELGVDRVPVGVERQLNGLVHAGDERLRRPGLLRRSALDAQRVAAARDVKVLLADVAARSVEVAHDLILARGGLDLQHGLLGLRSPQLRCTLVRAFGV